MFQVSRLSALVAENPLLLIPAALLLAVLGYAVLKRLLRLALFLLLFLAICAGLVNYFG